jgi:YkoY family integral membrane protein
MLHQTFEPRDLILVLVLVILESLLSIDNALVLGLLAERLPEKNQTKALTYGLVGSFAFRLLATLAAAWLLKWSWLKLLGGLYLLYVAGEHFLVRHHRRNRKPPTTKRREQQRFWLSVLSIELTDIAFATDSILAGIALVGPMPAHASVHPKLWVIFAGGMIGVVLMRVAASGFIAVLNRFPRFETTAYLLVGIVGLKLIADFSLNRFTETVNFESPSAAGFWIFWSVMFACVLFGFLPAKPKPVKEETVIASNTN